VRILEVAGAFLDAVSEDGDVIEVALAYASLRHCGQIGKPSGVVTREPGTEYICGEGGGAGNGSALMTDRTGV
jgi:hypothetical protein